MEKEIMDDIFLATCLKHIHGFHLVMIIALTKYVNIQYAAT